jgi:AAA ATPase domain
MAQSERTSMIRQIRASNFRSLAARVRLDLGALTVLVGPNGSGKSNTVDALVFLSDCMQIGLEGALTKRHGIAAVRRANPQAHPYDVSIAVDVDLKTGHSASYELVLTGDRIEEYRVKRERAEVGGGPDTAGFVVENGVWKEGPPDVRPRIDATGLILPLPGDARFAELAGALRSIASYSIYPDVLRKPQDYNPAKPIGSGGCQLGLDSQGSRRQHLEA